MSEAPWKPLEEWLVEKVPIEVKTKEVVVQLKNEYYEMHGSGKKAREFFNKYVENVDQEKLLKEFTILAKKQNYQETSVSLDELIKILYDVRSKFVHDAKFIRIFIWPELVASGFETNRHHIISTLDVELMQGIFEKGLLRYFGLLSKM